MSNSKEQHILPSKHITNAMKEQDISRREMEKFFGKSAFSEIIHNKRDLTLKEIKVIQELFGISADVLIICNTLENEDSYIKYPLAEMYKRKYISALTRKKEEAREYIEALITEVDSSSSPTSSVAFRQSNSFSIKNDPYAIHAWLLGVKLKAKNDTSKLGKYEQDKINKEFLKEFVQLSTKPKAPVKAKEFLNKAGIRLIVEPHFKKTHIDAAVFFYDDAPTIALTLRYDRVDYFWFTLLHELAHIALGHLDNSELVIDDLEAVKNDMELEADTFAKNIAIPEKIWKQYPLNEMTMADVFEISAELNINPALVAGQIRYKLQDYRVLSQLVGNKEVKKYFDEFKTAEA